MDDIGRGGTGLQIKSKQMTHEQVRHIIKWAYSIGDRVNSFHNFNQLATAYLEAHPEATAPPIPDTAPVHTVTAPPTLRERAEELLTEVANRDYQNEEQVKDAAINAMLQFASEVSGEKDREIASLKASLKSPHIDDAIVKTYEAYMNIAQHDIEQKNKRIAEFEAEVKRLNEPPNSSRVQILIDGLNQISTWDESDEDEFDDPGQCAKATLAQYINSK